MHVHAANLHIQGTLSVIALSLLSVRTGTSAVESESEETFDARPIVRTLAYVSDTHVSLCVSQFTRMIKCPVHA